MTSIAKPLAFVLVGAFAAGCGGGGGGAGSIAFDGAAEVPARYVSTLDSSATANAVAAGADPRHEFLPATFDCHAESDVDLSAPDLRIGFSGDGRYATADGEGRVTAAGDEDEPARRRQFRGGPLDGERVYLNFDEFGQRFAIDPGGVDHECYQEGASAARAQLLAYLATPQPGDYRCREPGGTSATLGLGADGTYAVDGAVGSWTLEDVVGNTSGRMRFSGGPLDGERARYSEEPDNGYRSFDVTTSRSFGPLGLAGASSELALTCESLGPPATLPLYGPAPAPALPAAAARLSGFWWYDDIRVSTNRSYLRVAHLLLRADGWAYAGTPTAAGVDCSRTNPNGLPFCDAYTIDPDGTLRLFRPYGETGSLSLGLEGGGLATIDGERARAVSAPDPARLVGERENLSYSQSGCVGLGPCSYSLTTRNLGLADNGRFFFSISSNGGSSSDGSLSGGPSIYAVGSSSASNIGSWSVAGNVLELAYDSGRTVRHFAVEDDGTVGVGRLMY